MSDTTLPLVVVLHGLHQNPWFVKPLEIKLQRAGFRVYAHRYHSVKDDITAHSHSLHQHLQTIHDPSTPLHIVAHSLGGLVARHFIAHYPTWQLGHLVTLGTPHLGSVCADYANRLLPPLIGKAYQNALDGQCVLPPKNAVIGVIAGNRPWGVGSLALYAHSRYRQLQACQHDGTVFVHETYLPSACDHIVMPVNHTGLLTNAHCARQVIYFLHHGQFER